MKKAIEAFLEERNEWMKTLPKETGEELNLLLRDSFKLSLRMLSLATIAKKDTYGYEIITLANKLQLPNEPQVGASKVYPVLHQMEKDGLIKGKWDKRRKVYSITPKGKKVFQGMKKVSASVILLKIKVMKALFGENLKGLIEGVKI